MKSLIDVYEIAKAERVAVDCFDFSYTDSISHIDSDGECYIAIDPFKLANEQHEKIKLAHELGHCVTGAFYNIYSACDIRERHEARAERWAFKVLIPHNELMNAVADGYTETWELAEYFDATENMVRKAVKYYQAGNK